MRRSLAVSATLVAALALPSIAQASTGTVLSAKRHQLQLISANRSVHAFTYRGHLAGLARGSELSYTARGPRITQAKVIGATTRLSFLATVVHSGHGGLLLKLADSRKMRLTTHQLGKAHGTKPRSLSAHAAGGVNITLNINGLQPGETVLVTESTDVSGNVTITITLPSAGGGGGSELTASGLVNNVNSDTFDIITADNSDLNFHMAAATLASVGMSSCDTVVVTYHVDAQMMIADSVVDSGPPSTGACSDQGNGGGDNGNGGSDNGGGNDWIGTVTAISATGITVDAGANRGLQTFVVNDPSVTLGFYVGDAVDVSYEQDGSQFVADSISYNDTPTSGVVTAIASYSNSYDTITMTDDYSLQSETFYIPVDVLEGQGVQIGDDVSVYYFQAARGFTIDCVQDNGPADGN